MFDEFVRPWVPVTAPPRVIAPKPPAEEFPDAFIEWGGASEFTTTDLFRVKALDPRVEFTPPPEKPKRIRLKFQGSVSYHEYRVEDEEDPEVFAVIRTAAAFTQISPDILYWTKELGWQFKPGRAYRFHCKYHDELPNKEVGDGQSPEAPPDINDIGKTVHSEQWNQDHGSLGV